MSIYYTKPDAAGNTRPLAVSFHGSEPVLEQFPAEVAGVPVEYVYLSGSVCTTSIPAIFSPAYTSGEDVRALGDDIIRVFMNVAPPKEVCNVAYDYAWMYTYTGAPCGILRGHRVTDLGNLDAAVVHVVYDDVLCLEDNRDNRKEYPLALLYGKNIYVLPTVNLGTQAAQDVADYGLDYPLALIIRELLYNAGYITPGAYDAACRAECVARAARAAEVIHGREVTRLSAQWDQLQTNHESALFTVLRTKREMDTVAASLVAARSAASESRSRARESLKAILSSKELKAAKLSGTVLSYDTDFIRIADPRTMMVHLIGKFRVTLDLAPGGEVREMFNVRNLTWQTRGYCEDPMHHPHVYPDGRPCLGTAREMLLDARQVNDYEGMVAVATKFLQSANVDDPAGHCVFRWMPAPSWEQPDLVEVHYRANESQLAWLRKVDRSNTVDGVQQPWNGKWVEPPDNLYGPGEDDPEEEYEEEEEEYYPDYEPDEEPEEEDEDDSEETSEEDSDEEGDDHEA